MTEPDIEALRNKLRNTENPEEAALLLDILIRLESLGVDS